MEGNQDRPEAAAARESAERFWHLGRGLKAAFFLAFVILVFIIAFREVSYDVRLDAYLGRRIATGGFAGLAETAEPGTPAPRSGWLWWLVAHGLSGLFGYGSIRVAAALLVAAGFAVTLATAARRANVVIAGLLLIAAAYLSRPYIAPGSQGAGIFFFAVLAALVLGSLESAGRRIWWAAGIMVLYVNFDLSWPAGAALCITGIAAAALSGMENRGRKAAALAAAVAATLLNPDFAEAWVTGLALPVGAHSVAAWLSPVTGAVEAGKAAGYLLLVAGALCAFLSVGLGPFLFAGAAALTAGAGLSVGSFPVFVLAAAAACGMGLAAVARRIMALTGEGSGKALARYVAPLFLEGAEPPGNQDEEGGAQYWHDVRAVFGLNALLAAAGLVFVLAAASQSLGRVYRNAEEMPTAAVDFVADSGLSGRALVVPSWAGCLCLKAPGAEPVASGRPLAASAEAATLTAWAFGGARWPESAGTSPREATANLGVRFALVPTDWRRAETFRGVWKPVYWDDTAAVLAAATPENAAVIAAHDAGATYPPYFTSSLRERDPDEIRDQLRRKIDRQGELAYAHYELAVLDYREKKYGEAEGHLNMALAEKPNFVPALSLMGDLCRARGADEAAIRFYAAALEGCPDSAILLLRLGNLLLKKGDWVRGLQTLRAAQAVDDRMPQLDAIRPGLRAELDEQVRKILSPPAAGEGGEEAAPQESGEGGEATGGTAGAEVGEDAAP